MQAIILAGGFGTRLRTVVSDVPKPLAPINGRPFLDLLLAQLRRAGFSTAVLAVGYLHEQIVKHVEAGAGALQVSFSVESTPLGTGGAIRQALSQIEDGDVFVINGDTYVDVDHRRMLAWHRECAADVTVCLTAVEDASRYGAVKVDAYGRVIAFVEKGGTGPGLINAGTYVLRAKTLFGQKFEKSFSFERDFLVPGVATLRIQSFSSDGRFLDIGTPSDYRLAQEVFRDEHP